MRSIFELSIPRDEVLHGELSEEMFAARLKIGDHALLYTPAEAERLQLRIKGKWQPPAQPAPTGGASGDGAAPPDDEPADELLDTVIGSGRPALIVGNGLPAQAFQQLLDKCTEYNAAHLRRLTLSFQGITRSAADNMVAVGLAIPQMGRARYGIALKLDIQFGAPPAGEHFHLHFQGDWDRYKRLKSVTDAFAREDVHSLNLEFRLVVDFERDLPLADPQIGSLRDVLVQMLTSPLKLEIEPVYQPLAASGS